jgi:hypothetical protein
MNCVAATASRFHRAHARRTVAIAPVRGVATSRFVLRAPTHLVAVALFLTTSVSVVINGGGVAAAAQTSAPPCPTNAAPLLDDRQRLFLQHELSSPNLSAEDRQQILLDLTVLLVERGYARETVSVHFGGAPSDSDRKLAEAKDLSGDQDMIVVYDQAFESPALLISVLLHEFVHANQFATESPRATYDPRLSEHEAYKTELELAGLSGLSGAELADLLESGLEEGLDLRDPELDDLRDFVSRMQAHQRCSQCRVRGAGEPTSLLISTAIGRYGLAQQTFVVTDEFQHLDGQLTFVSNEYPDWYGSEFNDSYAVIVSGGVGVNQVVASGNVNSSAWVSSGVAGFSGATAPMPLNIDLSEHVNTTVTITLLTQDVGDEQVDSGLLLDGLFNCTTRS